MPYYNRDPKRDHNFDNHPLVLRSYLPSITMPFLRSAALLMGASFCTGAAQNRVNCHILPQGRWMNGTAECVPSWAKRNDMEERAWMSSTGKFLVVQDRVNWFGPNYGWLTDHRDKNKFGLKCAKDLMEFPNACSSKVAITPTDNPDEVVGHFYIALYAFGRSTGAGSEAVLEGRAVIPQYRTGTEGPTITCSSIFKVVSGSCLGLPMSVDTVRPDSPPEPPEYWELKSHIPKEYVPIEFPKLETEGQAALTTTAETSATTTMEETGGLPSFDSVPVRAVSAMLVLTVVGCAICVRRHRAVQEAERHNDAREIEIHNVTSGGGAGPR